MSVREQALALRGSRVTIAVGPDDLPVTGVLRFVTPRDFVVVADEFGRETSYSLEDVHAICDARLKCESCEDWVNRLFPGREDERLFCASCSRTRAATEVPPTMECEDCERDGAIRSPLTDKWLCSQCHAKAKTLSGLGVERRVLQAKSADCHGSDTEDPRHSWHQVKGKRYHCKDCGARRFTEPLGVR